MSSHAEHAGANASTDIPDEFNPRHIVRRLVELALLGAVVAVAISALPGLGDLRHRFAQAVAASISTEGPSGSPPGDVVFLHPTIFRRLTSTSTQRSSSSRVSVPSGVSDSTFSAPIVSSSQVIGTQISLMTPGIASR